MAALLITHKFLSPNFQVDKKPKSVYDKIKENLLMPLLSNRSLRRIAAVVFLVALISWGGVGIYRLKIERRVTEPPHSVEKSPLFSGTVISIRGGSFVLAIGERDISVILSPSTLFYRYSKLDCDQDNASKCSRRIAPSTREEVLKEKAFLTVDYQNTDQGFLAEKISLISL